MEKRYINLVGQNCYELYEALNTGRQIGVHPLRIRDLAVGEEITVQCGNLEIPAEVLRTTNVGQYTAVLRKVTLN